MPVPALLTAILALLALAFAAPASAAEADAPAPTVTLTTSLGPIEDADEETERRPLRARGKVPRGTRVYVRFYRGTRHLGTRRPTVRRGRYAAWVNIRRTGGYRVRVTAKLRTGETIKLDARLRYGPKAKAPSAPDA